MAFHYLKNRTPNNGFKIEGDGKLRMSRWAKAVTYLWTEHYKKVISPKRHLQNSQMDSLRKQAAENEFKMRQRILF